MPAYAIVRSGGKQYRVREGDTIDVERLPEPEGERVELHEVLLLAEDGRVTVGTPTVPDVKVVTEVVMHGRHPKVIVFKYKAKTRYRKKTGHRQGFTRLAVQSIQVGEEEKPAQRRRARKAVAEEPAVSEITAEEPAVSEATAEEPVQRRRARKVVAEEPAVSEATAEEPVRRRRARKAVAEEPVVSEPGAEEPSVSEATAEEPSVSETVAEEPSPEKEAEKKPARRRRPKTSETTSTGE